MAEEKINVTFPDGRVVEAPRGSTIRDILILYDPDRAASILVLLADDGPWDHYRKPEKDLKIQDIITVNDSRALDIFRHSCAHLLAQAVQELYPDAKITIGPPIEDGFYYDFYREQPFTEEDLPRIEERMRKLAAEDIPAVHRWLPRDEAINYFASRGEKFKIELIEERAGNPVSVYQQGWYIDFCRGPHVPSTGYLRHFKLLALSGAYWRNDEHNPQLQRIYGTCFPTHEELEQFLFRREEAKRRDHRRLGSTLELFSIQDNIGPGLILWHPNGAVIRRELEDFLYKEHQLRHYQFVYTPHLARIDHWRVSGHLEFYREYMFQPMEMDDASYQLKPMNCPFHIAIYRHRLRSYRELPLRLFEFGTVYRYERSGVLHGLLRVRGFTQDDSHIFCTANQIETEVIGVIDFVRNVLGTFGFTEYQVFLSTRPEKFVGSIDMWDQATDALRRALERSSLNYQEDPGEGVFYGPKIDIKVRDALGRWWQCSTIQVDFNLPERFNLTYMDKDGQYHRVIMVHRALFGSMERFFGLLIEQFAGAFPFWIAPVQASIIPIADRHHEYARSISEHLIQEGFRIDMDLRNERMNAKVREAELAHVPFILIVGDREQQTNGVAVRVRHHGDQGIWPLDRIIQHFRTLKDDRQLELLTLESSVH